MTNPELLLNEPCCECGTVDRPCVPRLAQSGAVVCECSSGQWEKATGVHVAQEVRAGAPSERVDGEREERNGKASLHCG